MAVEALIYMIEDGTYEYVVHDWQCFVEANIAELGGDCCELVAAAAAKLGVELDDVRAAIQAELRDAWGR
jgi:hypothetical protein